MRVFESDCNDGKGNAVACHQVGEFLSVVKNDFEKAGKIFNMNCKSRDHAPSCFNLGRFLREYKPILLFPRLEYFHVLCPSMDGAAVLLYHVIRILSHDCGCWYGNRKGVCSPEN